MARDTFDNVPRGFRRSRKGWLQVTPSPQDAKVKRLQEENQTLHERIDAVMRRLVRLETKEE